MAYYKISIRTFKGGVFGDSDWLDVEIDSDLNAFTINKKIKEFIESEFKEEQEKEAKP